MVRNVGARLLVECLVRFVGAAAGFMLIEAAFGEVLGRGLGPIGDAVMLVGGMLGGFAAGLIGGPRRCGPFIAVAGILATWVPLGMIAIVRQTSLYWLEFGLTVGAAILAWLWLRRRTRRASASAGRASEAPPMV